MEALALVSGTLAALALLAGLDDPAPGSVEDAPQSPREAPRLPEPRKAIDGLAGFSSSSTLTFIAASEVPEHTLETLYVFPERVRWRLEPSAEGSTHADRTLRYQFGGALWQSAPGRPGSVLQGPEDARRMRLQNELRRVAMTWPAELGWEASVGTARREAALPGLGHLVAELDAKGERPRELTSYLKGSQEPFESLGEIQWREQLGRAWPTGWTLSVAGEPVWKETIDEVRTGQHFRDAHFQPPDQRVARSEGFEPRRIEIAPRVYLQRTINVGTEWPEALARAQEAIARAEEELGEGFEVDTRPTLLLDHDAKPTGLELRLMGEVSEVPPGWSRGRRRQAYTTVLTELKDVAPPALNAMRSSLEPGQRAGRPRVRIQMNDGRVGLIQLVLPLRDRG